MTDLEEFVNHKTVAKLVTMTQNDNILYNLIEIENQAFDMYNLVCVNRKTEDYMELDNLVYSYFSAIGQVVELREELLEHLKDLYNRGE